MRLLRTVHKAKEIYESRNWDRLVLEARLLTTDPIRTIAKKTGISLDVVRAYPNLFFDVRDRLSATDYIQSLLEPSGDIAGVPVHIVKRLAYEGGPPALDAVLDHVRSKTSTPVGMTWAPADDTERDIDDYIFFDRVQRSGGLGRFGLKIARLELETHQEIEKLEQELAFFRESPLPKSAVDELIRTMDRRHRRSDWQPSMEVA